MTDRRQDVDLVIVGAGFAGMYMLHRARSAGLSAVVLERGGGVGGTWYWNRYPGARCDIESMEYSFEFSDELQQEWDWSERYAPQPEILRYAEHVADRFDLRCDIRFDTTVVAATFSDDTSLWTVRTEAGEEIVGQFVVMATGCLSSANTPTIEGADTFTGPTYHTGRWPHEGVDFSGLRVGIIGTGSSAVQSIPIIAREAAELIVFQRTATYTVPAHNRPLEPAERAAIKADYAAFRAENRTMVPAFGARLRRSEISALEATPEERAAEFDARWQQGGLSFLGAFTDLLISPDCNEMAADYVRDRIREIVVDPKVAEKLTPTQVIGCKRLCVDTGYYETFNRPNVHLVDLQSTPIERITPGGIRTTAGDHQLDCIIYATGFDAMTGALLRVDIRGRDGVALGEAWAAGPRTYLGLSVAGFPNLFTITGPGSPSVLTNMLVSIQQHVEWIADCVTYLRDHDHRAIEATVEAQDAWVDWVNLIADFTLYPKCNSWYLGANVPGKKRVFMPLIGFPDYAAKCAQVAQDSYSGFTLVD